jgi:hypothetical protein
MLCLALLAAALLPATTASDACSGKEVGEACMILCRKGPEEKVGSNSCITNPGHLPYITTNDAIVCDAGCDPGFTGESTAGWEPDTLEPH